MKIIITVAIVILFSYQTLYVKGDNVEKCFSHCKEKSDSQQMMSCATDCIGVPNPSPEDIKRTTECTKKCGSNVNCHFGCIREYFQKGHPGGTSASEQGGKDNKDPNKPVTEKDAKTTSTTDNLPSKSGQEPPKTDKENKMSTEAPKSSVNNLSTSVISTISPTKPGEATGVPSIVQTISTPAPFSVPSIALPFASGFVSSRSAFSSFSSSRPMKTGTRSASGGNLNTISILSTFLIPWISYRRITA